MVVKIDKFKFKFFIIASYHEFFNPLSAKCLSVFDHFVGLALKGLSYVRMKKAYHYCVTKNFMVGVKFPPTSCKVV